MQLFLSQRALRCFISHEHKYRFGIMQRARFFLALKQPSGGLFCTFGSPITFRIHGSSNLLSGIPLGPGLEVPTEWKFRWGRGAPEIGLSTFIYLFSYLIPKRIQGGLQNAQCISG